MGYNIIIGGALWLLYVKKKMLKKKTARVYNICTYTYILHVDVKKRNGEKNGEREPSV